MNHSYTLIYPTLEREEDKKMYRNDVFERITYIMKNTNQEDDIRPCFAKMAETMGCDYRTVKAAYEKMKNGEDNEKCRPPKPSKLDPYKSLIQEKLELFCSYKSIYCFIRSKGYDGGYTILREYCRKIVGEKTKAAQMRFETDMGYQAQVDWKEQMMLVDRDGNHHVFNIFLMVMGFSRAKYVELTLDRNQDTLFRCLANAIEFFGGSPKEVLFDNMKTVADHSRGEFGHGVINSEFLTFARDALFEPRLCRAFRPKTKGKAEALAKLTERLRPYNGEFGDISDLSEIVEKFREDINSEESQATGMKPFDLLGKEKKYLRMPDVGLLLETYVSKPIERKVSRESMVTFCNCKYSVKPAYIGKKVTIEPKDGQLYIYHNKEIISTHRLSEKRYNYNRDEYIEIMKSDAYKDQPDDVIERIADQNLEMYDRIG